MSIVISKQSNLSIPRSLKWVGIIGVARAILTTVGVVILFYFVPGRGRPRESQRVFWLRVVCRTERMSCCQMIPQFSNSADPQWHVVSK
ncbi:MAG TPA: hypothetical protein VLM80_11885 [Anaerolineales bacterium]|nr:hypothetical protein [Anaerolineales bacterium]